MTGSWMTVIVPLPRPKPRLELGMTQLPLRQVACVIGGLPQAPAGPGGVSDLLAPASYALVRGNDDGHAGDRGPGGQFPDVQGGRQDRDHDRAVGDDQVFYRPAAGRDGVEQVDGRVLNIET